MKQTIRNISSAAFLGMALIATQATLVAQSAVKSTTTTKTTTTAGTISEFSPETIVVRTESSPDPVRYSYTKTTTYVDDAGAPVSLTVVKSGLPVTVYYTQEGDRMVASKVVVRKTEAPTVTEKTETTTKTKTKSK